MSVGHSVWRWGIMVTHSQLVRDCVPWSQVSRLQTRAVEREQQNVLYKVLTVCLSSQRRAFEEEVIQWNSSGSIVVVFSKLLWFWPQIKQDYPLNLSILISGGKETNKDSLSNGEWSGNGSSLKSLLLATANCSLEKRFPGGSTLPKLLGTAHQRGWQSRLWQGRPFMIRFPWVGLLGNAAQNWW